MTKMNFKQLINPHCHSESSLDGASTVDSIVSKNARLGATHVCITEHGNLNSAMELVLSCNEQKLTPILGIELYLIPPWVDHIRSSYLEAYRSGKLKYRAKNADKQAEEIERKIRDYYFHLTVHFKTYQAYQHFCLSSPKMNERAVVVWGEVKPLATIEDLIPVRKQITVCSSCMVGPVSKTFLGSKDGVIPPNPELAERYYCMLRELVGPDSFFVEIFPHDITHTWVAPREVKEKIGQKVRLGRDGHPVLNDEGKHEMEDLFETKKAPGYFQKHECTSELPDGDIQRRVNLFLLHLAAKYGDRVMVSLDSHYAEEADKIIQDAKLGNGAELWKFYNSYHVMSSEEAFQKLNKSIGVDPKTFESWIDHSYQFASLFSEFHMPTAKERWLLPDPPEDFLVRLKHKIDAHGRMDWNNKEMVDRLQKEIKVLCYNPKKNLAQYFFTVEDIADFARKNHILINVRGSAGGSLLLYLIGVSAVNPLNHDLTFERFLTEGRIKANTLPDADLDVSDQQAVFDYLKSKYGDGFSRLSTDTLLHLKSSIKDAERYIYGSVNPTTEALTRTLPDTPQGGDDKKLVFGDMQDGVRTPGLVETHDGLKSYIQANPEVWETVKRMLGIQRNKSVHACGVVLMDKPVQEYVPLISINGTTVTAWSPISIEAAGGVKYDILGLNTLRDIQLCTDSIKQRIGLSIDPWNLPFDPECVNAFAKADVIGVFQFDTPTIRPYLKSIIKPDQINSVVELCEVLAGITALGRPGTLDAPAGDGRRTLARLYVDRCNGEPVEYIHPSLEPILKVTMGVQLYQEQTLRIFRDLADMTYEEAEVVRRGIGKKDVDLLKKNFSRLKEKCLAKGWTESQVKLLIDQIHASSRYSFNKSHAISYAYVAYACQWLKTNYPLDWWKAILSNASRDEIAKKFWRHTKSFVVMPDINNASDSFKIENGKLIAPLSILNGIGPKAYQDLISRAPYKDFYDFLEKHFKQTKNGGEKSALTRPIVYRMLAAGVFDTFFPGCDDWSKKVDLLCQYLGAVNDKPPERIDLRYARFSSLGQYLIRKSLISVYSEDLRPIVLPSRGGKVSVTDSNVWKMPIGGKIMDILDGWVIEELKAGAENKVGTKIDDVCVLGYVIEEKAKQYKNKTKQATVMVVDVNGTFYEEILWPDREENKAPMGFKELPCLFVYNSTQDRVFLKRIVPLIKREDLENLGSVV